MKYRLKYSLHRPKAYDSYSLFEFCVNKLVQKMNDFRYPVNYELEENAFHNHIQWTNIIFTVANDTNKEYLSKVKSAFDIYFIRKGNKYKWDFNRIQNEHPNFFDIRMLTSSKGGKFDEMFEALDYEIIESKKDARKNTYKILKTNRIQLENGEKIYQVILNIEDDEEPKFIEDLPITIRVGGLSFETKVLDYDKIENCLFFQLESDISSYSGALSVQADASWILTKIKDRLKDGIAPEMLRNQLILKFIDEKTTPRKITEVPDKINSAVDTLDDSQLEAYNHSIQNDITVIWGPPGTGKSHTLASIIDTFFKKNEKTLVTCIANVAVDSIVKKIIDLISKQTLLIGQGEILRIGHTRDTKLLETEYLFPDNIITKQVRKRILEIDEYLQNSKDGEDLALKKERQDLREKLKAEVKNLIEKSIITFSTASKFFVDETLNIEYDNLIIDEASMVSIPHFIALGLKVKKRIIITGDFRQLGPVVLSQSEVSKKWLHRDIFEFCGIDSQSSIVEHDALRQLLVQRRSNELICGLINKPFYQGRLKSNTIYIDDKFVHIDPYKDKVIVYKSLKKGNQVEFTARGSRKNKYSANQIIEILDAYYIQEIRNSIGIITPYRGQVKLLQESIDSRRYSNEFKSQVKVGTIHSFQGSECDLIIFDTVDSIDENIGKLYRFDMGKRLVNVALSRAKYKLIVCGDLDVFIKGKGYNNIDITLSNIFNALINYKVN